MEKAFRFSSVSTSRLTTIETIVPFSKVHAIVMKDSANYRVYFGPHPEVHVESNPNEQPEVQLGSYIHWVENS